MGNSTMKAKPIIRSFPIAAAIATLLAAQNAYSAEIYWDGAASQSWGTAANWSTSSSAATPNPGTAPGSADDAFFNISTANATITMNLTANRAANSLTFRSTGGFTIGANSSTSGTTNRTLTVGAGGITKTSDSGVVNIGTTSGSVGVAVGADQTWTNNSSTTALNIGTGFLSGTTTSGTLGLGSRTLTLAGVGDFNFGAATATNSVIGISVGSTLIKNGSGTLTIGGDNAFSGTTLISGGTLRLATNGDINESSGITINGSTAKLFQTSSTAVVPTVTLTLGTLTGSGAVNTVNVANDAANVISNNNGAAGGALTVGDLTFAGAASVNTYNDTSAAAIVVTNFNTDAAGTVTVNPSVPPLVAGIYDLISYTAIGGAGAGQVVLGTIAGATQRQNPVFGNSGTAFTLTVGADNPPYWSGEGDGNWNTSSLNNWKFLSDHNPTSYLEKDNVLFNDLATPAGPVTVDINSANVSPSSTTFDGTKDYVLNSPGAFGIATGSLTKNGTGSLTISTANTYTGATAINAGTLSLGSGGTAGSLSPSSAISVASGATFAVNQNDTVVQGTEFGAITGAGGFTKSGVGITQLNSPNTFTGNISITGGTLQILAGGRLTGGAYAGDIAIANGGTFDYSGTANQTLSGIISGEGALVKGSSSTLTLSGPNTYQGSTTINAGRLDLAVVGSLGATSSISMADGTILRPTIDGVVINSNISLGGSGTTAQINAPFTASAGGTVETLTLGNPITGEGNLRLFGSTSASNTNATIMLNAQSTYSGNTELDTDGEAIHLAGVNLFVKLGVANALPTSTVVTLDGKAGRGSGRTVSLDLNGFDQELAGLAAVTTHVARNQRVNNTSATLATLTINSSSDSAFGGSGPSSTFSGNPVNPTAKIVGNIALTKTGAAKFTLLGSHDYTGDTTVSEGILSQKAPNTLNDASTVSIASDAFLDLDFDETGGPVTDTVDKLFIGGVQQAAGVYKATDNATDSGNAIAQITGAGTLTVTSGPAGSGYASWAATNADGEGPELDFDKDGVPNGVEYFMNASAGFTVNPQLDASNTIIWTNGGNIPASAYGTEFVIQTSSNLSTWTDVPVGSLTTNTDGPGGSLTYTLTGGSARFVRLSITPN